MENEVFQHSIQTLCANTSELRNHTKKGVKRAHGPFAGVKGAEPPSLSLKLEDMIGDFFGEGDVVGDEDEVMVIVFEFEDEFEDFVGHGWVEGGGGFIEEEEFGVGGDCADESDSLFLAA